MLQGLHSPRVITDFCSKTWVERSRRRWSGSAASISEDRIVAAARFGKGAIKGGKSTLSLLFLLFIFLQDFRDLDILLLRLKYLWSIIFDASKLSGCFNPDWIKLEDFVPVFLAIISNWNWSKSSCFVGKVWAKFLVWFCCKINVLNFVFRSGGKIENP